jgi:hypothetical protein
VLRGECLLIFFFLVLVLVFRIPNVVGADHFLVLFLIVTLFLFPPVIILISVVGCGLGCMAAERSIKFSIKYQRVDR